MVNLLRKFIPPFLLDAYHLSLAFLGAVLYGFPSKRLKVVGITGTNGKSTTVYLAAKILEEAGFKTAALSSIEFKIGEKTWPNTLKMTMPGRFKIQKFLKQAVSTGCKYAVLEVTSEGIKQYRHRFISFNAAVFTNLSPEHIERHGGFEKYKAAKAKLFFETKNIHIVNLDDANGRYFWDIPAKKKFGHRLSDFPDLQIKLPGEFNKYNAITAIYVGLSQGVSLEICQKVLEKVESIPGRMETVIKEPFGVIVDYAHNPDALQKVYKQIGGRKICVLGAAGGGRDKWKRPELGRIAAQHCDEIILTNEDPYDELPEEILNDIKSGITLFKRSPEKCYTILDRREAIKKALSLAGPGDMVVITGKGCEPWMCVAGGKKIPWDDRKIALDIFRQMK